ncbi:fungal-specific transcription factor domain-containing protein, partial [Colletotrichum falcatum]
IAPTAAAASPTSWVNYEETRKQPNPRPRRRIVCNEGRATFIENPFRGNVVDHLKSSRWSVDSNDAEQSTSSFRLSSVPDLAKSVQTKSMDSNIFSLGPVEMFRLWQVFLERVNPMIKVIHVPSLEPLVFAAATGRLNTSADFEALICSINLVAILALSEFETIQLLNVEKSHALRCSTLALKTAMKKIDFLKKYSIGTIQCLVLYLFSFQGQVDRHVAWIWTGTLVRIAQRMGLHRDGARLGLSPFDTEIRRRIWWQIIILETKCAILAGFCDTLLPPNWDTKMPSNVNDADLLPGSLEPVKSREGATEMAFCLMLYESRLFFRNHLVPEFEAVIICEGNVGTENPKRFARHSFDEYQQIVEKYEEALTTAERKYTNASAGGIHLMARKVRPLTTQRIRDMILHAQEPWDDKPDDQGNNGSFFRAWVIAFESDVNWYDSTDDKFVWYLKLHFRPDAFSAMIELLQWQPVGTLVDRAWKVIDQLYHYHPEMYDVRDQDNHHRAKNLLAGWSRRELAFRNLGIFCDTPLVVVKLRTFEVFE